MNTADAALEIGPITFGSDKFKVDGRVLAYSEVKNLSWHWSSRTINFINTQNAELSIFIRGKGSNKEEAINLSKFTMYVSPKLAEAYNALRERTWDYRIEDYLEQMATRGCFRYRGADFYTDGTIRQAGDVFQLSKASIGTFELSVKLGGMFSRSLSISLQLDHDIIHSILARFKKAPESPASYVSRMKESQEEHQASRHWFFDTIRLCAKMAMADGSVDPDEVLVIKEFVRAAFDLDEDMLRRAITIFNETRESSKPVRFYAQRLFNQHGTNTKILGLVLNLLRDVALADGVLHATETAILEDIARAFGMDPKRKPEHREQRQQSESGAGQGATQQVPLTEEKRHGRVLGLSGKVTVEVIRGAYRKLVFTHHPDKFHNAPEPERKRAHAKMVEINAAYAFFRERYEF